jgi:hypothetical protein
MIRAKKENLPAKRIQAETTIISLLPSLLPHLQWWINRENVSVPVPTLTLYTDASNLGWELI